MYLIVKPTQWDLEEITLTPTQFLAVVTPTSPGTARVVSFYSQGFSDSIFSPFRDYYTSSGTPVVGGIISSPTKYDIAQRTPSMIYYGTGQALPYSQYVSFSVIQDQRTLGSGSDRLVTICSKPTRNLDTASRLFARWRVGRLLRDDSDQHKPVLSTTLISSIQDIIP